MGSGRAVSVGDIRWVDLPAANGHEQRGRRPAVILAQAMMLGDDTWLSSSIPKSWAWTGRITREDYSTCFVVLVLRACMPSDVAIGNL